MLERLDLGAVERDGLLDQGVLARPQRGASDFGVGVGRRADADRVDVAAGEQGVERVGREDLGGVEKGLPVRAGGDVARIAGVAREAGGVDVEHAGEPAGAVRIGGVAVGADVGAPHEAQPDDGDADGHARLRASRCISIRSRAVADVFDAPVARLALDHHVGPGDPVAGEGEEGVPVDPTVADGDLLAPDAGPRGLAWRP